MLIKLLFILKLVVPEQLAEDIFGSLARIFLLSQHVTQIKILNKIVVAIINQIDRKETLIGRLAYAFPKNPYTSEHETPNLITVNGYYTRLKLNTPECQSTIFKNAYFTSSTPF